MKKCRKTFPLLVVIMSIFLMGCAGPLNEDIEQAVRENLKKHVPISLVQPAYSRDYEGMQGGKDAIVEEVQVIRIGNVQKKDSYKYWPIEVYVKGTCTTMFSGVQRRFEGETKYNITKDANDRWVVK